MKKLLCFLLSLFTVSASANEPVASYTSDLQEFSMLLDRHASKVTVREVFDIMKMNIPRYEALFKRAFSDCRGLKVDIVLRTHINTMTKEPTPREFVSKIERSNENIKLLLDIKTYDLVSLEGASTPYSTEMAYLIYRLIFEPWNFSMAKELGLCARDMSNFERALPKLIKGETVSFKAGSSYAFLWGWAERNMARTFGCEDGDLMMFSTSIMLEDHPQTESARKDLRPVLMRLRSAIALANSILEMKARNARTGAIIFGRLHGTDFKRLGNEIALDYAIRNM